MREACWRGLIVSIALLALAAPARAAGPLITNGAGQPLVWTQHPIPYNPDQGELGFLTNAQAVAFVEDRLATWSAVPTASISFTNAGPLPVDVTAANVFSYFDVCSDSLNPIIFDSDGSIIRTLFGIGNENFILGAAGPECFSSVPPVITGAGAILNGRFIDGVNSQLNPEISLADFAGVFTHEFGHFLDLDHSQINLTEGGDANPANDDAIATMFPILINGAEQATLSLDDEVSVSMLYPSATFFSATGSIRGSVLRSDGVTPFQGAYVIARNTSNPRLNAVGVASGFLFDPGAPGGPPAASLKGFFELDGLTPGASYTVEIEAVDARFTGGSRLGPLDPPATVSVPEFWNGASEAATNPPDDPSAATLVAVAAGSPVTNINVILNSASGTLPPNDLCSQPTLIASFPYNASQDTTGASESATDPVQSCTGSRNSNTVWYAVVPPQDGIVTFDTCGSTYDTVVTASTGTCSSLSALACNDDVGSISGCGFLQSRLSIDVVAGHTYLVEVSQYGAPGGGTLTVHASLGPRNCSGGACLPGRGGKQVTQCMAEWRLEPPPTFTGRPPATISCRDGDSCDLDNSANDSCTFYLALCLNNHDPNLTCTPSDTATVELLAPNRNGLANKPEDTANADALLSSVAGLSSAGSILGICRNQLVSPFCTINAECNSPGKNDGRCYRFVRFNPSLATPDRCAISANVVVPLRPRPNGRFRAASKRIRVRAASSAHIADTDSLTLRCLPSQ